MLVTRKSIFTGVERTREIDITPERLAAWEAGELIQRVAPLLSDDDREFLLTGATPEEWERFMGEEE